VANLNAAQVPTLTVFANPTTPVPMGMARLIVRHVAASPAVDVYAGSAKVISALSNPDQATLVVPAGSVTVRVDVAGTSTTVIGPDTLDLKAGTTTIVYAIGSAVHNSLTAAVQEYYYRTRISRRRPRTPMWASPRP